MSEFADGAFEKLDPFTSMIWPSDLEEFNKTTQGKFSGVGVQIQSDEDGSLRVVSPLEDTPAYKAGIKSGDIITYIDGKSAKNISINRPSAPSPARRTRWSSSPSEPRRQVEGIHDQSRDDPRRQREGIFHRPGGGWDYTVDPQKKIAYIRITNFTADTRRAN